MLKSIGHLLLVKNTLFHWLMVLIGLLYLYFLSEHITSSMNLIFLSCLILSSLKVKANTPLKIFLIILICTHHGFFYGLKVTTEAAMNFILGMCGLKMLEQNNFRDRHLLLFIVLLLLNAALLFEKSLFIFFYVLLSYLCLILVMSSPKWHWKYLFSALKSILFVSPLIITAYFFFPRWNSQLFGDFTVAGNAPEIHKIGLTMDVNFNHLSSVIPNSALSFLAFAPALDKPLYWRSHTLSETDGWNWERSSSDTLYFKPNDVSEIVKKQLIEQKIQLETNQRYFIGLDRSMQFSHQQTTYLPDSYSLSYTFPQRSTFKSYTAYSLPSSELKNIKLSYGDFKNLIKLPQDLNINFPKLKYQNSFELQKELRLHFNQMKFSYSYEPGLITNAAIFLSKRAGFCSHFASYTALLLRANNIPARLVSGYLGGQRYPTGNYYRVVENDAHVWVEAYLEKSWLRIDPTLWVSSIRSEGGNEALIANNKNVYSFAYIDYLMQTHLPQLTNWISEIKFAFEKANSDFQFWLENFNLNKQREVARQWQLTVNEFYLIGILTLFICIAIMSVWIVYRTHLSSQSLFWLKWQKFWISFEKNFPQLASNNIWGKLEVAEKELLKINGPMEKKWLAKIAKLKKKLYS